MMFHLWHILAMAILCSVGYIIGYKIGMRKLRAIVEEERENYITEANFKLRAILEEERKNDYNKVKNIETVSREREGQNL